MATGAYIAAGALEFAATVVCRGRPDLSESAAEVLAEPLEITRATGTVVVPAP